MEKNKKAVVEAIWLKYFNQYLYEHGIITEEVRNRTIVKINNRTSQAQKTD